MCIVSLYFTLYYDPVPPTWKVMVNSIYPPVYSIFTNRKGVSIWYYVVSLSLNLSSVVLLCPPVVRLSNQVITGSPEVPCPEWKY